MRALMKDVSIDELKQLREEGYSNREIADCLDVSEVTVYRYIGKMPKELKAHSYSEAAKKREQRRREKAQQPIMPEGQTVTDERKTAPQTQNAVLAVTGRKIVLEGVVGRYTLSAEELTISTADDKYSNISVNTKYLADFAAEILAILRHKSDVQTSGPEAW